jgi:hypothetical protein
MDLYGIVRRNGWATAGDLEEAAARSTTEGDKEGSGVRWIRILRKLDCRSRVEAAHRAGELGLLDPPR